MSGRILVVDDILPNVKLLEAKLTAEYFEVLTAFDGAAALRLASSESPDLILLDVMMPGMDVVDEEKIREGGCEAYIAKPISVTKFLQTVEKFLS